MVGQRGNKSMSGLSSAKSVSQAGAWRGHEPPSPRRMPTLPTNRKSLSALAQCASLIFAGRSLAEESGAGQADAACWARRVRKAFRSIRPRRAEGLAAALPHARPFRLRRIPSNRGDCRVTSRTVRLLIDSSRRTCPPSRRRGKCRLRPSPEGLGPAGAAYGSPSSRLPSPLVFRSLGSRTDPGWMSAPRPRGRSSPKIRK